jgi:hypothetical protein
MLSKEILIELKEYIDGNLSPVLFSACQAPQCDEKDLCYNMLNIELESFIKTKRKPTFSQVLFKYIDKKGTSDSEVYKKAYIDRRHFSKIRSIPDYKPGKNAVIALALALELNKKETDKLLSAAGYSLSDSETLDLVIQFCLEKKIYDILEVNEALDYFSMKPLIGTEEAK